MLDSELNKIKTAISYINSSRSLLLEVLEEFGKTLDNPVREILGVDYTKMNKKAAIAILVAQNATAKEISEKLNISMSNAYKHISKAPGKVKKVSKKQLKRLNRVKDRKERSLAICNRANELFAEGMASSEAMTKLKTEFNLGWSTIYKTLKDNNITNPNYRPIALTPELEAELLKRYKQGDSVPVLSKEFGASQSNLYKMLAQKGVLITKAERAKLIKHNISETLENLTDKNDPEITVDGISGKLSHFLARWGLK